MRAYNVIDSDGHVLEPPDLWVRYLETKYRDRALEPFVDKNGKEQLRIEVRPIPTTTACSMIPHMIRCGPRRRNLNETQSAS
jgi:hypothetical protein